MREEKTALLNPFVIDIEPMEKLLLVNFEKDPDAFYIGFEPQVFDDDIHGKGHLLIAWRKDGKVDVYHEPSLKLRRESYDITGKGLEHMVETAFSKASYEINQYGVQALYQFVDVQGRMIRIRVSEKNTKKRKPFGLLAPMGDAAENPSALPLILLQDFYFVRKKNTELEILIDGKVHQPDGLPMPIDKTTMLFTRYSPSPLIARFNPEANEELPLLLVSPGQEWITSSMYDIELQWNNNQPGIRRIVRKNKTHPITLEFPENFPNMENIHSSAPHKGTFILTGHPTTGSIEGHYNIEKTKDEAVKITLIPSGGWIPKPTKFSLRLLYQAAKLFKNWPKTYQWTAYIEKQGDQRFSMKSDWERI